MFYPIEQQLIRLFIYATTLLAILQVVAEANDTVQLPQNVQQLQIPEDGALDSDGNPLDIPAQPQSSLHYRSSEAQTTPINKHYQFQTVKQKRKSHKQQQTDRQHVADNPNCRWLDKRMQQLEKQIKRQTKPDRAYHATELRIRNKEWNCLKCGAEGPQVADHAKCQYRR